jgi:hypothetical protein
MVVTLVFEVEHQGGKIVVQIGFKRLDVHLVYSCDAVVTLDRLKGAAHTSEVNSTGEGMDFTTLDGQETLLAEWRCCEVARTGPAKHSPNDRRLFRATELPETSQADANGVTL